MLQLWKCNNVWKKIIDFVDLSGQLVTITSRTGGKKSFFLFEHLMQSRLISIHRKKMDESLQEGFFFLFLKKTCTETAVWLCCVLGFSRAWRWTTRKLQTSTTYQGPCQRNKIKWGLCHFYNIYCVGGLGIILWVWYHVPLGEMCDTKRWPQLDQFP